MIIVLNNTISHEFSFGVLTNAILHTFGENEKRGQQCVFLRYLISGRLPSKLSNRNEIQPPSPGGAHLSLPWPPLLACLPGLLTSPLLPPTGTFERAWDGRGDQH